MTAFLVTLEIEIDAESREEAMAAVEDRAVLTWGSKANVTDCEEV